MDSKYLKSRQYPVLSKEFLGNYEWRKKKNSGWVRLSRSHFTEMWRCCFNRATVQWAVPAGPGPRAAAQESHDNTHLRPREQEERPAGWVEYGRTQGMTSCITSKRQCRSQLHLCISFQSSDGKCERQWNRQHADSAGSVWPGMINGVLLQRSYFENTAGHFKLEVRCLLGE